MLGAFLLMRRTMLDEIGGWDAGFRHYCEDIDLCYRAMQAGWERWYVPDAVVTHDYAAVIDRRFLSRHTLWHAARDGALRAQASRAAARAVSRLKEDQYARQAERLDGAAYADATAYLAHRAELDRARSGPALEPGDEVLDLACGDGGLGELLVARASATAASTSTPEMVEAARTRLGARAAVELGDLNDYVPPSRVAATTVFRAIYYATRPARVLPPRRRLHGEEARLRPQSAPVPRRRRRRRPPRRRLRSRRAAPVLRPADRRAPAARSSPSRRASSARARSRALALRVRFTYLVAASR